MVMSCCCKTVVTDLKSAKACLQSRVFLFCAAEGTKSINSLLPSSRFRFGRRHSNLWNISGTPCPACYIALRQSAVAHQAESSRLLQCRKHWHELTYQFQFSCQERSQILLNQYDESVTSAPQKGDTKLLCCCFACRIIVTNWAEKTVSRQGVPIQCCLYKVGMVLYSKVSLVLVKRREG